MNDAFRQPLPGTDLAYFDARADLGHYLEYFCFPPGSHLEAVPSFG